MMSSPFFFCTISHNNYGRNLSRFGLSPYPPVPPRPPTHIDMMMIYSICAMKRKRFVCSLPAAVVVGCHSHWLLQFHRSGSSLWESCNESRLPCSALLSHLPIFPSPCPFGSFAFKCVSKLLLTLTICCRPSQVLNYSIWETFSERECGKVKRKITKCGMFCDFTVRHYAHEVCSKVEVVLVLWHLILYIFTHGITSLQVTEILTGCF